MYYRVRNKLVRDLLTNFDTVLEDIHENVHGCQNHIDEKEADHVG